MQHDQHLQVEHELRKVPSAGGLQQQSQGHIVNSQLTHSESVARLTDMFGMWTTLTAVEQQRIQRSLENRMISVVDRRAKRFHIADILRNASQGAQVMVEDDFSRCFKNRPPEPWNWNAYLRVLWYMGIMFRYCVVFPLRFFLLLCGFVVFIVGFNAITLLKDQEQQQRWERKLIRFLASAFVLSWTGVVKYHGVLPKKKPGQIYVANHTSMIDMIVLQQQHSFAVVGQSHPGWVGWFQKRVLHSLGCIWFNRSESKDRTLTAQRIKSHIHDPDANRLLIFPEGTCVNNEYCVQFKRGAFELADEICPIAMKYNHLFVDAFWNSRARSFHMHLFDIMTSWALVCDVYYLDPVKKLPGESAIDFSNRVKTMIADTAGLKNTDWNGYLKYFRPSERFVEHKQKLLADSLLVRFSDNSAGASPVGVRQRLPRMASNVDLAAEEKSEPTRSKGSLEFYGLSPESKSSAKLMYTRPVEDGSESGSPSAEESSSTEEVSGEVLQSLLRTVETLRNSEIDKVGEPPEKQSEPVIHP